MIKYTLKLWWLIQPSKRYWLIVRKQVWNSYNYYNSCLHILLKLMPSPDWKSRTRQDDQHEQMLELQSALDVYLPYLGHVLMTIGYILEQLHNVGPPIPSALVLIGHICILTDPRALSPGRPVVQIINIIFLVGNILMFIYDVIISLRMLSVHY